MIPAELLRRVSVLGYEAVAITDHVDFSNLEAAIEGLKKAAKELNLVSGCRLIVGVEITHVPPELFKNAVGEARRLGAELVVAHGETPVEPVAPGTNLAAIEAGVDILAHPGLISEEEVRLAAKKGVFLEVSARKGHCLGNGRVVALARAFGAKLVINSDAHAPSDFMTPEFARRVGLGAGLSEEELERLYEEAKRRFLG